MNNFQIENGNLKKYLGNETRVVIPNEVRNICAMAFSECDTVAEIIMPEGLEFIGEKAFENCTSLQKIYTPQELTFISKRAFAGCSSLTEIKLSDSIKLIGERAFARCDVLKKIVIPIEKIELLNDPPKRILEEEAGEESYSQADIINYAIRGWSGTVYGRELTNTEQELLTEYVALYPKLINTTLNNPVILDFLLKQNLITDPNALMERTENVECKAILIKLLNQNFSKSIEEKYAL